MADDPFPTNGATRTPTAIGDAEWRFVFLADGAPYAHYSVQILDNDGAVMDVKTGILFEQGGADRLTVAEKQAISAMNTRLRNKAAAVWIP